MNEFLQEMHQTSLNNLYWDAVEVIKFKTPKELKIGNHGSRRVLRKAFSNAKVDKRLTRTYSDNRSLILDYKRALNII